MPHILRKNRVSSFIWKHRVSALSLAFYAKSLYRFLNLPRILLKLYLFLPKVFLTTPLLR